MLSLPAVFSGDWETVIEYGGHTPGLAEQMPDQSWDTRYYATLLWDFADGNFSRAGNFRTLKTSVPTPH